MSGQLGKYRIDGILGKGAMGVVYRAFDPGIGRVVALKTIRTELFSEAGQVELIERFRNEAQAAGRLSHPHIVAVYDYGEQAQAAPRSDLQSAPQAGPHAIYLAMEFVEGTSLDALLAPGQPLPLARTLAWMGQLLAALDYAHGRGVVHRDVKPANILVTQAGQVKITDFGIARIESPTLTSSTLTLAGSLVGTPSHMSPEQCRGDAVDARSDVFSAAIVLYQMLTGVRPFAGAAATVMQQILQQDPAPPSTVLSTLGTRFDAVLARAMAREPDARFPGARAFHEALLAAADSGAGTPDPDATALAGGAFPLPAALPATRASATGARPVGDDTGNSGNNSAGDSGAAALTAWQRAAFPEVEATLAHQIGPLARYLLKNVAARAEDMDQLSGLLLPHIPSTVGRVQFEEALVRIGKKLNAGATGGGAGGSAAGGAEGDASPAAACAGTAAPGMAGNESATQSMAPAVDQAYADAATHRLVAIIGPIGRVVVRRAMRQAGNRQAFVQLLAGHIDDPAERARFVGDAGQGA